MVAVTYRISIEKHKRLQLQALAESRSMQQIIDEAVEEYLKENSKLEEIQQLVLQARAQQGGRSQEESIMLAEEAAILDDEEGLGSIEIVSDDT